MVVIWSDLEHYWLRYGYFAIFFFLIEIFKKKLGFFGSGSGCGGGSGWVAVGDIYKNRRAFE
jgi:hypothetical protein